MGASATSMQHGMVCGESVEKDYLAELRSCFSLLELGFVWTDVY